MKVIQLTGLDSYTAAMRKTYVPCFSVGKSGISIINSAFFKEYNKAGARMYYQLIKKGNKYYLLLSFTPYKGFLSVTIKKDQTTGLMKNKVIFEHLGKKGVTMRYKMDNQSYSNGIMEFALAFIVEDEVTSKYSKSDFLL